MKRFLLYIRKHGFLIVIVISLACFFLIGLSLFLFFRFAGGKFSHVGGDWAAFGSYASGTAGILLSFLNTLLLVYLTYDRSKADQHRWVTDLRNANFKDLIRKFSLAYPGISNKEELVKELEVADLNYFFYLGDKEWTTLSKIQEILIDRLKKINKFDSDSAFAFSMNEKMPEDHSKEWTDQFEGAKKDLIILISAKIMDLQGNVNTIVSKYCH